MSDSFKRRSKRSGSSVQRYTPAEMVRSSRHRRSIGTLEIAGAIVTGVVAISLITLIWIVTERAIEEQRGQIRDLVQRTLSGDAAVMAQDISHELLVIDQSLTILQAAWTKDSKSFDLQAWKASMPTLTGVTDDLFIADDKHVVQQDILPQAVGQGVASAYVNWPHGSMEKLRTDTTTSTVSLGTSDDDQPSVEGRRFLMYVVRALDHPDGWLIGASYRTKELGKLFADASLGMNSFAALVDMPHAGLQTVVGPASRRPRLTLSNTALYEAMSRTDNGIWEGESPIDGVQRIHAFHRVPDRDMTVIVAASEAEAMAPAEVLVAGDRMLAVAASGVVAAIAAMLAWALYRSRANRRRERAFARDQEELERLRSSEATNIGRSQLQAARLRALVEHGSDGVALVDIDLRVAGWNRRFERGIGVALRENMPLDAMVREQVMAGLYGPVTEIEAGVMSRVAALRAGDGSLPLPGPDGQESQFLRGLPIAEGGTILLLSGLAGSPAQPVAPAAPEAAAAAPAEPALQGQGQPGSPAPIEW